MQSFYVVVVVVVVVVVAVVKLSLVRGALTVAGQISIFCHLISI